MRKVNNENGVNAESVGPMQRRVEALIDVQQGDVASVSGKRGMLPANAPCWIDIEKAVFEKISSVSDHGGVADLARAEHYGGGREGLARQL